MAWLQPAEQRGRHLQQLKAWTERQLQHFFKIIFGSTVEGKSPKILTTFRCLGKNIIKFFSRHLKVIGIISFFFFLNGTFKDYLNFVSKCLTVENTPRVCPLTTNQPFNKDQKAEKVLSLIWTTVSKPEGCITE